MRCGEKAYITCRDYRSTWVNNGPPHTYRSSSMAELTVGYISGIIAAAIFVGWFLLTIAHDILRECS